MANPYELAWDIENFFAWWKRHLKVYHLIARSEDGLMVQILAGLITNLLLAIYCHQKHSERVTIKKVRQLRTVIQNQLRATGSEYQNYLNFRNQTKFSTNAKNQLDFTGLY